MSSDAAPRWHRIAVIKEAFVYMIKQRKEAGGIRCSEWGLEKPLASVSVKVVASDQDMFAIELHQLSDGVLFARTDDISLRAYVPGGIDVEPALDSSRYFVIRIKDPKTGRKMPVRSFVLFSSTLRPHSSRR
jgi:hypothetical protein